MSNLKCFLWASSLSLLALPGVSRGVVSLNLTDNDATPTSISATKGGTFTVTLNLVSTAEQTTGLDYFLQDNGFVSGTPRFRISDRNLTGSTYSDFNIADATVEAQPSSLFNPSNDNDLGASLANPNSPNGAGTFLVANYTIGIDPSTPNGTYTISTFSNAGTGYIGPGPTFSDTPFNQQATFSVTVTPEPAGAAVAGVPLLGLLRRRRPS